MGILKDFRNIAKLIYMGVSIKKLQKAWLHIWKNPQK